jgi:hypothetical protein
MDNMHKNHTLFIFNDDISSLLHYLIHFGVAITNVRFMGRIFEIIFIMNK